MFGFSEKRLGLVCALIAAVCFAALPVFAKIFYAHGGDVFSFAATERSLVLVVLFFFCYRYHNIRFDRREMWMAFYLALILLGAYTSQFYAIGFMKVGLVITFIFLYPLLISIFSAIAGMEKITMPIFAGMVMAFLGIAVLTSDGAESLNQTGVILSLISAVLVAGHFMITGVVLKKINPMLMSFYMTLFVAPFFIVLAFLTDASYPALGDTSWLYAVGGGCVSALGQVTLFYAISKIGAVKTSLLLKTEPVWAILAAFFILGEMLEMMQYVGAGMVLAGIFVAQEKKHIRLHD